MNKRTDGVLILIVEDNTINLALAKALVQRIAVGCRVATARNGEEAMDAFTSERPVLIYMDLQMPIKDGFEAADEIRQLEKADGTRIPIIALTGGSADGERDNCIKAGMDDFLLKPIGPDDLRISLERWLPE
ncbi:MAG: response regulator [Spirochaetota bacterium]